MRRRAPRAPEKLLPLPNLAGLDDRECLDALHAWADAHELGGDPWAAACTAVGELEAFGMYDRSP